MSTVLQEANEAMNIYSELKNDLLSYMGSKPLKTLKKDPVFIKKSKDLADAKSLWYDLNVMAINQAKIEKLQSVLN